MNLPELRSDKLKPLLNESELRAKLLLQLAKDLNSSGLNFSLTEEQANSYDSLLSELEQLIRPLFESNSQKLYGLLYRIDVSEREIAKAGMELKDFSHSQIIAHAIIFRELKKVLIREHYDQTGSDD